MNKLMGFYELRESALPVIPWEEYKFTTELSNDKLWTIRSAVYKGEDLNLPRKVGCRGAEAAKFAADLKRKLGDNGIVIYYPYFVAKKSGTINVYMDKVVIEAVREDLWNLVSYSDRDITMIYQGENVYVDGDRDFFSDNEINELLKNIPKLRYMFRGELLEGKSILVEWSYARDCDANKEEIGDSYLVFYEARTV